RAPTCRLTAIDAERYGVEGDPVEQVCDGGFRPACRDAGAAGKNARRKDQLEACRPALEIGAYLSLGARAVAGIDPLNDHPAGCGCVPQDRPLAMLAIDRSDGNPV